MKKLVSMLTAIALVFSLLGTANITAAAAAKSGKTGSCTWVLDSGVLTISGKGKTASYDLQNVAPWGTEITRVVVKNGVTSIGNYAFAYCEKLENIEIPDSLTDINEYAFYFCGKLKSITIPKNVTTIKSSAFYSAGFSKITFNGKIKKIGDYSFVGCSNLKSFTVPDTVTEIGEYAFADCYNMETVKIPEGVKKIGTYAFAWCDSLKIVEISESVNAIGESAFSEAVTFNGVANSFAEKYAKANGIKFVAKKTIAAKSLSAKLSKNSYTYNGKTKTPIVTVKDSNGKLLRKGIDYTVSYASGRKNVGKYTVKVTFKGSYSGSKTLSFTILPKGTSVKSVTPAKKKLTVKWGKQAKQTSGYELQYSTSKKFKGAKTVTASSKKTSKSIKGLKAKKKYYVRIRTYKTVGGKRYYSAWSKAVPKKTK